MGNMCEKCTKGFAWVLLVLGVAFLGRDLDWWNFWGVSWWTVVFLLFAFVKFGKSHCPECKSACSCSCEPEAKPKRKR